jgi:hypothetical protein
MGLDMYAYTRATAPADVVDFKSEDVDNEFFYWRKHPDLHGWMEQLYLSKGGESDSFNCVNVLLNEADLDRLRDDIATSKLPRTDGFFFGKSYNDDDERNRDLEFIEKARELIKNGQSVYYTSWW